MNSVPSRQKDNLADSPLAPRTIAVTGATGFIGRTLVQRLLARGFAVKALVRGKSHAGAFESTGLEWITGDLADPASLTRLLEGTEAVAHCAGMVRGRTPRDFDPINVQGLTNLVRAAHALNAPPRLVVLSSLAAREPLLSPYAASKRQGEKALAAEAGDLAWVAIRPPAVYGPGDREMLPLFKMMARGLLVIPGDPKARFSLIFVDDLAEAMIHCLTTPGKKLHGTFEIDDGHRQGYGWEEVSDIARRVLTKPQRHLAVPGQLLHLIARLNAVAARLFDYQPMLTPGKVRELRHPDWVCDSSDFCQATGWQPTVDFEKGLAITLNR